MRRLLFHSSVYHPVFGVDHLPLLWSHVLFLQVPVTTDSRKFLIFFMMTVKSSGEVILSRARNPFHSPARPGFDANSSENTDSEPLLSALRLSNVWV